MITYNQDGLSCMGIFNTKETISCFLVRGSTYDTIKMQRPLLNMELDPEDPEAEPSPIIKA